MSRRDAIAPTPSFTERSAEAGLTDPGCSWAFTLGDYDGDADVDIFYTNHVTAWFEDRGQAMHSRLYENRGGLRFAERGDLGLDARVVDAHHASFIDVDRDLDLDLFVVQGTPKFGKPDHENRLYLQEEGRFTQAPLAGAASGVGWRTRGGAWGDLDRDGDADFVGAGVVSTGGRRGNGTFVLENRGPGGLIAVQGQTGLQRPEEESFQASIADIDNDGAPEVFLTPRPGLYRDQGDGSFEDEAAARGLDPGLDVSSSAWADFDNDGDLDLLLNVTNFILVLHKGERAAPMGPRLYRNDGTGHFTDATALLGPVPPSPYPAAAFGDLDNDGDLDLVAPAGRPGEPHLVLLNGGPAAGYAFTDLSATLGLRALDNGSHTDLSLADLDVDGHLDILIANGRADCKDTPPAPPELWHNGGSAGHYARVQLLSTRSAPGGLGARVWVHTAEGAQHQVQLGQHHLSQDSLPLHFGLGEQSKVRFIEVRWPTGLTERYPGGRADRLFTVVEGGGEVVLAQAAQRSPPNTR